MSKLSSRRGHIRLSNGFRSLRLNQQVLSGPSSFQEGTGALGQISTITRSWTYPPSFKAKSWKSIYFQKRGFKMINFGCKERVYAVNFSSIKVNNPSRLMGCFKLGNRCNTLSKCYGLVEVQFMKYTMNIPDEKVNKSIKNYPDFSQRIYEYRDKIQHKVLIKYSNFLDKTTDKTQNKYVLPMS